MKLATIQHGRRVTLGIVEGERFLDLHPLINQEDFPASADLMVSLITAWPHLSDRVSAYHREAGEVTWLALADAKVLAPFPRPTKNVFCIGRNYKAHIEEGARARGKPVVFPTVPEIFTKPPTGVVGQHDDIRLDRRLTQQLDYEVELAIVIGKTCRDVPAASYSDVVFGYTIVNDISAREIQQAHIQFFKGKSLDTFCPMGPVVVTAEEFGDPGNKRIGLKVNGETRQDSSTSDLLFNCAQIVESLSQGLTLEPGDVIATGTPAGVALGMTPQKWLQDGDLVEAEVEGIGVLSNRVREVR